MFTRKLCILSACLVLLASQLHADSITSQGTFANGAILNENPATPGNNVVTSSVNILQSGFIEDITITIEGLDHTNVGDVSAELQFSGANPSSGEPAYLFFRPNFNGFGNGSISNFDGNYTFGTTGANLWQESAIDDNDVVPTGQQFFTSDEQGLPIDLAGSDFFGGLNVQGVWTLIITDNNPIGFNEGSVESFTIDFEVSAIPEPTSALLITFGIAAIGLRRRR